MGLSFKPNTDDIRESVAIPIIEQLISEGVKVTVHDPMVHKISVPSQLSSLSVVLAKSSQEAIKGADAAIIVTSWLEYVKLPAGFFKKYMKNPVVIDGRRIYDKNSFMKAGIIYKGIGL